MKLFAPLLKVALLEWCKKLIYLEAASEALICVHRLWRCMHVRYIIEFVSIVRFDHVIGSGKCGEQLDAATCCSGHSWTAADAQFAEELAATFNGANEEVIDWHAGGKYVLFDESSCGLIIVVVALASGVCCCDGIRWCY